MTIVRQDLSSRFEEDQVESQLIQSPESSSSTALKRSNASTTSTKTLLRAGDESNTNTGGSVEPPQDLVRKRIKRLRRKKVPESDSYHSTIKYASLVLLVAQMVGLVLLMRYSRTHKTSNEDLYLASTAVFVMEV